MVGFRQGLIFREMFQNFFLHCQGSIFREMFEILKEGWLWSGVDFQGNVSEKRKKKFHCQGSVFREMFQVLKEGWFWSGVDFQ